MGIICIVVINSMYLVMQATFTLLPLRFVRAVSCLVKQQVKKGSCSLKGDQLFDIICVGIFACTVLFLKHLKLQVIYTAVEMIDKVKLHSAIC